MDFKANNWLPIRPVPVFAYGRLAPGLTNMFAIIGFIVVLGAVMGGYLMEHGQLKVLIQPA